VDGARCQFGAPTINVTAGEGDRDAPLGPPKRDPTSPPGGMSPSHGGSYPFFNEELGSSVMMLARVTNRNFSEEMGDTSSTAYRGFVTEFSRMVRPSLCPPPRHWGATKTTPRDHPSQLHW